MIHLIEVMIQKYYTKPPKSTQYESGRAFPLARNPFYVGAAPFSYQASWVTTRGVSSIEMTPTNTKEHLISKIDWYRFGFCLCTRMYTRISILIKNHGEFHAKSCG